MFCDCLLGGGWKAMCCETVLGWLDSHVFCEGLLGGGWKAMCCETVLGWLDSHVSLMARLP